MWKNIHIEQTFQPILYYYISKQSICWHKKNAEIKFCHSLLSNANARTHTPTPHTTHRTTQHTLIRCVLNSETRLYHATIDYMANSIWLGDIICLVITFELSAFCSISHRIHSLCDGVCVLFSFHLVEASWNSCFSIIYYWYEKV